MSRRFLLTISTAASLWGLYTLYTLAVSPFVRLPDFTADAVRIVLPETVGNVDNVRMAEQYLSQAEWLPTARYQLQREEDGAYFYANHFQPTEEKGQVLFEPFAMIWKQEGADEDDPPLTIMSDRALVQFESAFSFDNPTPGRPTGGAFTGRVTITGPNGLYIQGNNFQFQEAAQRVWSDNPVRFAYETHTGSARGVQIDLLPMEGTPPGDRPAVAGAQSITLRGEIELNLQFDEEDVPEPVSVHCAGRLTYDLPSNVATFQDIVRVYRNTTGDHKDGLRCDMLKLFFAERAPKTVLAEGAAPKKSSRRLEMQRLQATGDKVELISQENALHIETQFFEYDLKRLAILLRGYEWIRVNHKKSQMYCFRQFAEASPAPRPGAAIAQPEPAPEIVLTLDDDERIVTALCRGRGKLQHIDEQTSEPLLAAIWKRQLYKHPSPDALLDVIELEEDVMIWQPDRQTGMQAQHVTLWTTPLDNDALSGGLDAPGTESSIRPMRLLAVNGVAMVSPQLEARTERAEVVFSHPGAEVPLSQVGPQPRRDLQLATLVVAADGRTGSAGQGRLRQVRPTGQVLMSTDDEITDPFAGSEAVGPLPGPDASAAKPPKTPQPPIEINAASIFVKMDRLPESEKDLDQLQLASATAEGDVVVRQQAPPGEQPLHLTGDRLELEQKGKAQEILKVFGQPAHIRNRGLHIQGNEVELDRGTNLAQVLGSGLLQFPIPRDLRGNVLPQPQLLNVYWREGMQFDGKIADFSGDVRAEMNESRMRCQQMRVTLTGRLSFAEEDPDREDLEIEGLTCRDGVEFDNYEYEGDNLVEIRRASAFELKLDQTTGRTEAQGPGWIKQWRRGKGKRAALSPTAVVQANRATTSDTSEWEYTRIDFSRNMLGNIEQKHTTFHENVEIVYGPVERPMDVIERVDLPKDGAWMRCDQLEFTLIDATDAQEAHVQVMASGDSHLEGQTFSGWADFVSFDEAKGLYVLRSLGNPQATIWQQEEVGREFNRFDAQRIEFIPQLRQLHFDRVTGFGGAR